MKAISFFVLAIVLISAGYSCKKKLETCTYSIEYHSPSVAFVGFSEAEMRSTTIATYKANTNFNELVSIDSLAQTPMSFSGDTAYAKIDTFAHAGYGFKSIAEGFDYKIWCHQTGSVFLITNVRTGEKQHTWLSEHCSPGAGQVRFFPLLFDVNGVPGYPGDYGAILFLRN